MTQVYDEDNNLVPVTIIEAGPCPILQVKTNSLDGYSALQIGYNPKGKSPNKVNRCNKGHASKANVDPQQVASEFRVPDDHTYEQGATLTVGDFSEISLVDIISTTKGKGFQGVEALNFGGWPCFSWLYVSPKRRFVWFVSMARSCVQKQKNAWAHG